MIPISVAPKRFVAALNGTRLITRAAKKSSCFNGLSAKSFSALSVPVSASLTPSLKKSGHGYPQVLGACSMSTMPQSANVPVDVLIAAAASAEAEKQTLPELNLYGKRDQAWWTGISPATGNIKQGVQNGVIKSLPLVSLHPDHCTRERLQHYYDNTWALTETLLSALQGEEAFTRPPYHDLRHPMIFYYGHPAVFYTNKLRVAGLLKDPINPYFESVFEVGVDEMSWDDLSKNKMPWPSVAEVHDYRKKVYSTVSRVIQSLPDEAFKSIKQDSPLWSLVMCMEHERIHLETSSVLLSEMPTQFLKFPQGFPSYHPTADANLTNLVKTPVQGADFPENKMIDVAQSNVTLGKPESFPCYGWDNEYGNRTYSNVPAFRASQFKISNGEFLEFVKAGGYSTRSHWSNAGWEWRAFRNAKWPFYWHPTGPQGLHQYNLRLIFDVVAMPWNWPAAVNLHEAEAYARWKSSMTGKNYRLMSELEQNAIRDPVDLTQSFDKVDPIMSLDKKAANAANTGLQHASMSPVDAYPANIKGFYDVNGNAWEWNMDYFCALPGFKVHPYYEDFSTPCFDGLHNVIQSASFISTGNLSSTFSRFHFRPHFLQHSGFRLTEQLSHGPTPTADTDAPGPFVGRYPYRRSLAALEAANANSASHHDAEATSHASLSYHFAKSLASSFKLPIQPPMHQLKDLVLSLGKQLKIDGSTGNVLEIGCGSGGLVFQLAEHYKNVVGLDHSHGAIKLAQSLRAGANPVTAPAYASTEEILFPKSRQNIEFRMSDPMSVPAELFGFDTVIISDVLDKVSSPNSVLGRLGGSRGLVKDGGMLVVYCGYDWNEDATPKSLWLGATNDSEDSVVPTADASAADLAKRLEGSNFELIHQSRLPFYWQTSVSDLKGKLMQVSVFRKRFTEN
jgi:5-histidylcysteine sulfoxide synthase